MFILVSKRPLTLEEKIARAQQKLREKAEQRKRQYDKEINLRSGKSRGENTQEMIAKPSIEEIETQIISEPVAENSIKAPVHHEHELRDALEVEIYHKPCDDLQMKKEVIEDVKMPENKEIKESLDESRETGEQNNENQVPKEQPATTYNDSTMSETVVIAEKGKFFSLNVNEIENSVHIQNLKSAEDITENDGENVKEIHKEIDQKETLIIQNQSAEPATPKELTEKKEGFEDKSQDNFDYTQTVINVSVNEFEKNKQIQSNQKELENITDFSEILLPNDEIQNVNFNEVTGSIIEVTEVDQEQNEEKGVEINNIEVVNVDDIKELDEKETVTLSEEKKSITAKTTSDEKCNEESNVVNNTDNQNVSDDVDIPEVNANEKPHVDHENPSNHKVDSGPENYEPSDVIKAETEFQYETPLKSDDVIQYNEEENYTVELSQNKNVERGIKETKQCLEPHIDKEPEDTSDSIHTNNSDGTISEHRVLVVELAEVKNDNASVPEQNAENDVDNMGLKGNACNLTDTPVHVSNEDTDSDFLSASEHSPEKADTDQLSKEIEQTILERSKRNLENICEGIETSSNTTDVGKSDSETISLGKFSSMDDSAPEDGNDNVGIEMKSNDKSANYTNTSAMDLETAAVTIQKVFRTFLFKSRASTFEDLVNDDNNLTDEDTEKVRIFYDQNEQSVSTALQF